MKELLAQTGIVIKGIVNTMKPHQKGGFNVLLMVSGMEKFINVRVSDATAAKVKEGELCSLRVLSNEWQGRTYYHEAV